MILSLIETETRRLLGGITSTEYSDADIDNSVNRYIQEFTHHAVEASGEWQINGEVATSTLTASQTEYVFPSSILQLHRIEIDYTGGTNTWTLPEVEDMRSIRTPLSNTSGSKAGSSTQVRLFDNSFFLRDLPASTVTGGIKIWYSDEAATITDAQSPNLPKFTHLGLVYGACFDFAVAHNLDKEIQTFKALLEENISRLKEHYANKTKIKRTRIRTRTESYT